MCTGAILGKRHDSSLFFFIIEERVFVPTDMPRKDFNIFCILMASFTEEMALPESVNAAARE
jgi:hypothetical protein